jgi:GlcNAc-P-P-Und epimerase
LANRPLKPRKPLRAAVPCPGLRAPARGYLFVSETVGVIGGSGFIGSRLVGVLISQGHSVRVIDKQRSRTHPELWTEADVLDPNRLLDACRGCDGLYNLAAEHRDDVDPVELYHAVNVGGAFNVCAAAETLGIRKLIFTSTVAVYGFPEGEIDEAAPPNPFNEYGRTKLEAERAFLSWAERSGDRSLTIVRPTVVFGPGNRGNVYVLLEQIANGRSIVIGDGRNKKSMAYVANVADFLAHALEFKAGIHIYNYADKPDHDMNELVAIANETLGRGRAIRVPYMLAMAAGMTCDLVAQLTRRQLSISSVRVKKYASSTQFAADRVLKSGFRPRHSLREALVDTVRHEFVNAPPQAGPWSAAPKL